MGYYEEQQAKYLRPFDNTLSATEVDAEVARLLAGGAPPRLTDAEDAASIAADEQRRAQAERAEVARGLTRQSNIQPETLTAAEAREVARLAKGI